MIFRLKLVGVILIGALCQAEAKDIAWIGFRFARDSSPRW
jgi:hypothetical protein